MLPSPSPFLPFTVRHSWVWAWAGFPAQSTGKLCLLPSQAAVLLLLHGPARPELPCAPWFWEELKPKQCLTVRGRGQDRDCGEWGRGAAIVGSWRGGAKGKDCEKLGREKAETGELREGGSRWQGRAGRLQGEVEAEGKGVPDWPPVTWRPPVLLSLL